MSDPKEYVIKTNCSLNLDFEEKLGERVFVSGGKETVMTIYSREEKIKEYFQEHKDCSLQYEEMSIIMKLLFLKQSEQNQNEYVVKMRDESNEIEEKVHQLLNELDLYLNELKEVDVKEIKNEKVTKNENNNEEEEIINHEKILKLMKKNKEMRKSIKSKTLKMKKNRQLTSSNSFRLLEDVVHPYNNEYYMSY